VRTWLAGLLRDQSQWLARPLIAALAAVILLIPLYPLWQGWVEADQSSNYYYQDLARKFVEKAGSEFVLVESGPYYDDLEAILYVAWVEKGWYGAQTVTPGGIDPWLGSRPVYAWYGDADLHPRYVQEPVEGLPGMALISGVREK